MCVLAYFVMWHIFYKIKTCHPNELGSYHTTSTTNSLRIDPACCMLGGNPKAMYVSGGRPAIQACNFKVTITQKRR